MWKWILGAIGTASVAGIALAARDSKNDSRRDARTDNQRSLLAASLDGGDPPARTRERKSSAPKLTAVRSSYWDAFGLDDEPGLDAEKQTERAEKRQNHIAALARIIASEAGTMSRVIKRVVAWIARNRSLLIKRPMFDMAAPGGEWGPISTKRPMASSQPATDETLAIAAEILAASQSEDPTIGATHGYDRALQDRLAEQGLVISDAATVADIWKNFYGLRRIGEVETWVLYR